MAPQTADPASGRAGRGAGFGLRARPGLTAVTVCAGFLVQHNALKLNMSVVPCLLCVPEPVVHCRSLGLMPRSQNQLIPQYTLEGRKVSGGVAERVLGHLCPGH